jgi:DNA-binding NtrC family response regulator
MKTIKTSIKSTLIIDHEEYENQHLKNIFYENDLKLDIVLPGSNYIDLLQENKYNCLMINSDLVRDQSVEIINNVKINLPWVIVIVLLKNPSYEKIFHFVRQGVDDFILKPFNWNDIEKILRYYNF